MMNWKPLRVKTRENLLCSQLWLLSSVESSAIGLQGAWVRILWKPELINSILIHAYLIIVMRSQYKFEELVSQGSLTSLLYSLLRDGSS